MLNDLLEDLKSDILKEQSKNVGYSNHHITDNIQNSNYNQINNNLTVNISKQKSKPTENKKEFEQIIITSNTIQKIEKLRCFPLFIGGPELDDGITENSFNPKNCSSLRCTNCDHTIKRFIGKKWIEDLNYLFFRNYISNTKMLETVL